MAWINGLERKRFNEEQKRLAEQYCGWFHSGRRTI